MQLTKSTGYAIIEARTLETVIFLKLERLDRAEAFRYMGYKSGAIPENINALADECERRLLDAMSPKFVYAVFDIERAAAGVLVKNTPLMLCGKSIAAHLRTCERCVLFAATLGAGADGVIRGFESGAMEKAVIADCLASAAIEQVCELAETEIHQKLSGQYFTWRFSPGYGDFPLDIQRDFLNVLNAQKRIGLTVTENLIMIPRKSVTAVIGVSGSEIPKGRRGCAACGMREGCSFREQGAHC